MLKKAIIIFIQILFLSNYHLAQKRENKIEIPKLSEVKEDSQKVNILNEVAFKFVYRNIDSTFKYANEALKIAKKINFYRGIINASINIGIYYDFTNDTIRALAVYQEALDLAINKNYPEEIGRVYFDRAYLYNTRQNFLKASENYDKASKYYKEANNSRLEGYALIQYGSAAYYTNKTLLSTKATQEAIKILTGLKDSIAVSNALINLSLSYTSLKKFQKANECLTDAWEYVKNYKSDSTKYVIIYDMANNFESDSNYSKALEYYVKSLDYAKRTKNKSYLGSAYTGLASTYFKIKNYKEALEKINIALPYIDEKSELVFSATAYSVAARIYSHFNKINEALKYINRCLAIASKPEYTLYRIDSYEVLSIIYEKTGDFKKSLEYYKKYKSANDSVYDKTVVTQISEFQTLYETEKKDYENAMLKKERELTSVIVNRQYSVIFGISAGLLLLIGVAIFYYYLYTHKKKTNKILVKQKEEIEQLAKKLTELNATKDKFFSIIAHDLKNPFHTLMSMNSLLLENYDEMSEEDRKEFIKGMFRSTKNAHVLLENLLQWSRSQTGRIEYQPEEINLFEVVEMNKQLLKSLAEDKRIIIVVNVDENINVFSDRNMLNTILRNLLTNAIKFTGQYGKISINAKDDNNYIIINVKDNGIGINDDEKDKIFSLGETPIAVGTKNEKGTGLGLLICKEFVEAQNGKIWFESQINNGSTFFFTIPKYDGENINT